MQNISVTFEKSKQQPNDLGSVLLRPLWLNNDLDDDVWSLNIHLDGIDSSKGIVNWKYNPYESSEIKTGNVHYWIGLAKRLTYFYMESDKTKCGKASSLAVMAREIRSMCLWFCYERKCSSVSEIELHDIKGFENYVAKLGVKVNTVLIKLTVIKSLWVLREELNEGLVFNPYVKSNALKIKAKKLGECNQHTKTIKPLALFKVINFSLETISGADKWIELLDVYLELKTKKKRVSREFKIKTGASSGDLIEQVRIIYGAAIVLIFSLLAERKHELSATKFRDVIDLLEQDENELDGVVHKTAKTIGGRRTKRPVIKEVKTALSLIVEITKETRKTYDGDLLLIRHPLSHSASKNPQTELCESTIYSLLNTFSNASGYEGELRPHMFRRAFSMIWAWRYEVGDIHLLSKILYHNNEEFTKFYTEDEDVWEYLPEAQQELAFEVMEGVLTGKNKLYGGFGKVLERYGRMIVSKVSLSTPERVGSLLSNLLSANDYKIIAHDDGYCFMSENRAKHAQCSTNGRTPDYSNRRDEYCLRCQNFGVDENRSPQWEKRLRQHTVVYKTTDIEILKKASKEGIKRAKKVLSWIK